MLKRPLVLLPLLLLAGCRKDAPGAAAPHTATLAAGTPVDLVLFDELTSGGSEKGTAVRLALKGDVEGVPALSPATGTVSESRTEGTLGAFMNRPARLNLTLGALKGPSGEDIPLSADPKETKDYELNRANTGRPDAPQREPEEVDVAAGVTVQELIAKGQSDGLDAKGVGELARKLGMTETAKLADAGRLEDAQRLVRTIRDGGTIASLASGGTVAAALELVNLAGDVGHRLGRTLGGRNIRAYPGTVVRAYVARDTTVTVYEKVTHLESGGDDQR